MPTLPKTPDWKRVLEIGMQFTEPRRAHVRKLVDDLVAQGHVAREQAAATVEEIVALGQTRAEEVRAAVRAEVQRQVRALGLATQDDLAALEKRITRRAASATKTAAAGKSRATTTGRTAAPAARRSSAKKAAS
jgi:polyhydroxyalkanoate synthesis regulator phasin